MSFAVTRTELAYRVERLRSRPPVAAGRNYGELASKVFILALFSALATTIAQDFARTGHATGLLLLVSEALVVALTLVRRMAAVVDRSWQARVLTMFATFGPPLVRPAGVAIAPESLTIVISAMGLIIVVLGKLSLGRSFGLTPANRGVVCSGIYRVVRHPIYLGYLITHIGFVVANPTNWNLAVLALADLALMLRAMYEEKTLAQDPEYRAYVDRVRWRIVPGVF
jgi:protein-S-isoprenylcysteine O-methyltransferase Ste14